MLVVGRLVRLGSDLVGIPIRSQTLPAAREPAIDCGRHGEDASLKHRRIPYPSSHGLRAGHGEFHARFGVSLVPAAVQSSMRVHEEGFGAPGRGGSVLVNQIDNSSAAGWG